VSTLMSAICSRTGLDLVMAWRTTSDDPGRPSKAGAPWSVSAGARLGADAVEQETTARTEAAVRTAARAVPTRPAPDCPAIRYATAFSLGPSGFAVPTTEDQEHPGARSRDEPGRRQDR